MPDRVRIKVCGLKTPEMIDAAVDAGVDAVGVVLSPSPRQVTPERAANLVSRVPGYVAAVAVYRHPDESLAADAQRALPERALHQSDAADFQGALRTVPIDRRVPVVRLGTGFDTEMARHEGSMVLVEGANSGTGREATWHDATVWIDRCSVIVAGGLNIDNVAEVVRTLRPFSVDVSSGVERELGVKDAGMIRAFVAAVREGDRA